MTALATVEALVARVVEGSVTEEAALAILAHWGLTASADYLSTAAQALRDREGLKDGQIDPAFYLDEPLRIHFSARDVAISRAAADFAWAVNQIAQTRTATHDAQGRVDPMGAGTGEPLGIQSGADTEVAL